MDLDAETDPKRTELQTRSALHNQPNAGPLERSLGAVQQQQKKIENL